uniref:Uncharacterized protein n=1 Tax=Oryza nivara TaxID=4536 RepID=A0A0E0H2S3_ORYNI
MLEKEARHGSLPSATRVSAPVGMRYVVPSVRPNAAPLRARFRHPPRHLLTTNGPHGESE